MDKKKIIYISIILILTVILSITYFSYAFFTRQDIQNGKLNIVTGTLKYKITSSDLDSNNSIILTSKQKKKITISLTSLNDINSKYILYYTTANSNFNIGYSSTTVDQTSGIINANSTKNITISIQNNNSSSITLTFGVIGGFVSNSLALSNGTAINTQYDYSDCDYEVNDVWNFAYKTDNNGNGIVQTFNILCTGKYKLEVWGAQGYSCSTTNYGGHGGYTVGTASLVQSNILYIYVGQEGQGSTNVGTYTAFPNSTASNGYNNNIVNGGSGGGSTHISLLNKKISEHTTSELDNLLVVAGGGGASTEYAGWKGIGGVGGGTSGGAGIRTLTDVGDHKAGGGGTQNSGGTAGNSAFVGSFGQGGFGTAAGGGGYYGGGGSTGSSAGGGSGYIGNVTNGSTLSGSTSIPNPFGEGNITGKTGNGYARITYLGK